MFCICIDIANQVIVIVTLNLDDSSVIRIINVETYEYTWGLRVISMQYHIYICGCCTHVDINCFNLMLIFQ